MVETQQSQGSTIHTEAEVDPILRALKQAKARPAFEGFSASPSSEATRTLEQQPPQRQIYFCPRPIHLPNFESIERGFYSVVTQDSSIFLDPMDGRGLTAVDNEVVSQLETVSNYQQKAWESLRPNAGWKIHLAFDSRDTTKQQQITEVLERLKETGQIVSFKIGKSGEQEGKDATLYVGQRTTLERVAALLQSALGSTLDSPRGETLTHDVQVSDTTPKIMARFDADGDSSFHQYGVQGIPFRVADVKYGSKVEIADKLAQARKLLTERYGAFFSG